MPSLEPPEDESIRTLYVAGLDKRINEQDLRDNFYAHVEIESIKMVLDKACAFVTYTSREGAENAAEELSNKLGIKGLRLKHMWGKPHAPKPESETSEGSRQQASVAQNGMLPRAVISQQQNQFQPSGSQDQPLPMHYFNMPAPPEQERTFYPSMEPQRMGALVPTRDWGNKTVLEKLQQGQHYAYQAMPPLPPPCGQYHNQLYPPYGYMPPIPPYQQYLPYPSAMPPPPQASQTTQQCQQSGPPGLPPPIVNKPPASGPSMSAPSGSAPSGSSSASAKSESSQQ